MSNAASETQRGWAPALGLATYTILTEKHCCSTLFFRHDQRQETLVSLCAAARPAQGIVGCLPLYWHRSSGRPQCAQHRAGRRPLVVQLNQDGFFSGCDSFWFGLMP